MASKPLRSLRRHRVPAWWRDAKLGIFVHWTPASVPGWAPTDSHIGELLSAGRPDALAENPYTEWYQNSLRFPDSSASRHHREAWGDTPYRRFCELFTEGLRSWDPDGWARRFAATGARYVVLVGKHHDGWCLWPTDVANPHRGGWHSRRDIVGELREAVLGAGLRFGIYYSGGLDWTFDERPIGNLGDLLAAVPRGRYPAYAEAHVRELVARYRPSVLWNDIAWPSTGARLWPMMADYYAVVPDGVLNDRWMPWSPAIAAAQLGPVRRLADSVNARVTRAGGGIVPPKPPHFDVRTPEYNVFDDVQPGPWECVRGMDQSFGYNRNSTSDHFLSADDLVATAADIVAKGGNLLLNVGPRGEDATIPDEQLALLEALGAWSAGEGSSIVGSRPWVRAEARSPEGRDLRFWASDRSVFAAVGPGGSTSDRGASDAVTVPGVEATPTTQVLDSEGRDIAFSATSDGVQVRWQPEGRWPVLELRDVVAAPTG